MQNRSVGGATDQPGGQEIQMPAPHPQEKQHSSPQNRSQGSETVEYLHRCPYERPQLSFPRPAALWLSCFPDHWLTGSPEYLPQPSGISHFQFLLFDHEIAENFKSTREVLFPTLGIKHLGGICHYIKCCQTLRNQLPRAGGPPLFPLLLGVH